MTRHLNRSLPFHDWPIEDQKAWSTCYEGEFDIFDERSGAKLAPSTIYGRRAAYAMWLGFLQALHPEALRQPAAMRVERSLMKNYVEYLRENCRETTISINLSRLHYALRDICVGQDWAWLYRISRRIAWRAAPLKHPPIISLDLYALGLRLMDRALWITKKASRVRKSAAVMYRDGLLIATLAEAPMRRRAFAALRLGENVVKIGSRWQLVVLPELSKTKTLQNYQLSERLSSRMDTYLDRFRPAFPGANSHDYLWTYIGRPMTDKMIRRRTIKWTKGSLDGPVSPHRFRTAAANFISLMDPENVRVASNLLGHKSFGMTEKHYIDAAQSRIAGRELAKLLQRGPEANDGKR